MCFETCLPMAMLFTRNSSSLARVKLSVWLSAEKACDNLASS